MSRITWNSVWISQYFLGAALLCFIYHMICLGMPDEREGLFEIIQRAKNHYQKRAYQCIKCLVTLFTKCSSAHNMLNTTLEFRRKWALSVEWLQDELERVIDWYCLFQFGKMPSPAERMAKNIEDHVFFEKIGWSLSKGTI